MSGFIFKGIRMEHLLEVKELETSLLINKQWFPTIDKVSFKLDKGEVLGIVGESGCGKSILNKSIIKLLPEKISKLLMVKFFLKEKNR